MTALLKSYVCLELFILIAQQLQPSVAILEEDAGKYDWHIQTVGHPSCWKLPPPVAYQGNPHFYVGSHEGVIAKIDTTNGNIIWRVVSSESYKVKRIIATTQAVAAVLTPNSNIEDAHMDSLLLIDAYDGRVLWDADKFATINNSDVMFASFPNNAYSKGYNFYVATIEDQTRVVARFADSEKPMWQHAAMKTTKQAGSDTTNNTNVERFYKFLPSRNFANKQPNPSLFVLCKTAGSELFHIAEIESSDGRIKGLTVLGDAVIPSKLLSTNGMLDVDGFQFARNSQVAVMLLGNRHQQELVLLGVRPSDQTIEYGVKEIDDTSTSDLRFTASNELLTNTDLFVAGNDETTLIFECNVGNIEMVKKFDGEWAIGPFYAESFIKKKISHRLDTNVMTAVQTKGGVTTLRFYKAVPEALIAEVKIERASSNVFISDDAVFGIGSGDKMAAIVSSSDSSITYFDGAVQRWVREEALSNIKSVLFYDLPPSHNTQLLEFSTLKDMWSWFVADVGSWNLYLASTAIQLQLWMKQTADQMKDASNTLVQYIHEKLNGAYIPRKQIDVSSNYKSNDPIYTSLLSVEEKLEYLGLTSKHELKQITEQSTRPPYAEILNIKKSTSLGWSTLIVVLTSNNQLLCLHAATGLILWKKYVERVVQFDGVHSSIHTVGSLDQPLVLVESLNEAKQTGWFVWMSPLDGSIIYKKPITFIPRHVVPFSQTLHSAEKLQLHRDSMLLDSALVVDKSFNTVLISPDNKTNSVWAPEISKLDGRFHLYETNLNDSKITGYRFHYNESSHTLLSHQAWVVDFGASDDAIIAWSRPLHSEGGSVPVQVAGNISLLHRYINPNVLYVITRNTPTHPSQTSREILTLNAVDVIRGSIVHSEVLPTGATTPIHMTACDHFIIVHYWNARNSRYEMRSIELFKTEKDKGPLNLILSSMNQQDSIFSSFDLSTPVAVGRTYVVPFAVSVMTVTQTRQGITPRSILLGMTSHQLYSLPQLHLNVRNPEVDGKIDKSSTLEGLIAFNAIIPFNPDGILSYNKKIYRMKSMVTHPSALESTSLAFTHGFDLFYTTVQTSKGYDKLTYSSELNLILISFLAAIVGVIYSNKNAMKKKLDAQWK